MKLMIYSDDANFYCLYEEGSDEGEIEVSKEEHDWIINTLNEWDKVQEFIKKRFG